MTYADEKLRKRLKLWMKWTATGDRPLPKRQGWNEKGMIRSDPFWKLVSRLKFTEDAPRFCHSAELQNPTVKSRLRRRVARRRVLENPDPSVAAIATKLGEFSANIGKLHSACLKVTLAAPAIFHRPDKKCLAKRASGGPLPMVLLDHSTPGAGKGDWSLIPRDVSQLLDDCSGNYS